MKTKVLNNGWTLIEVVLAMTILSVIGLSLYATFSKGLDIWKKVTAEAPSEDITIFLDKFAHDLRSTFVFAGIPFEGKGDKAAFTAMIEENTREGAVRTLGRVAYFFDAKDHALKKSSSTYSELYENKPGLEQILVKRVDSVKFLYYYYIRGAKEYTWVGFWPPEEYNDLKEEDRPINMPLAVRVEIKAHSGAVKYDLTRTIAVPVGYYQLREKHAKE